MRSVQSKLHLHDLGTQFCDLFVPASGATKSCQHFLFVRLAPQYRLRDARETAACLVNRGPVDYRSFTRFHRRSPLITISCGDSLTLSLSGTQCVLVISGRSPGWSPAHPLQWPISCRSSKPVVQPRIRMTSSLTIMIRQAFELCIEHASI